MQLNIDTLNSLGKKSLNLVRKGKNQIRKASDRLKRLKTWHWLVIVAVAGGAATGLYFLLRPKPEPPQLPIVATQSIEIKDMEIYGEYVGRIRAQQFVEIRARVEGYLESMLFDEGTRVEKNQLLFVIDPQVYQARVEKAKALLSKNRALALKAERDLNRIKPLYEQDAASQLDLDNATAAYESAIAEVQMSEADLIQAEIALGYTAVRSPISGYISERSVDIGTLVGPGGKSLLATVVKSDTVQVDFSMTGLDYLKSKERNVNLGQKVAERKWNPFITITLVDNTIYPYSGLVDFADPQVDPQTGTFTVRAAIPNPDHILLPGQITRVKLLLDVRENAIVVPQKALIIDKGGAYIFVIRPDSICEKRFIEIGPEIDNSVIVERGLASNEKIVVEGYHKLIHGAKVNPIWLSTEKDSLPEGQAEAPVPSNGQGETALSAQSCKDSSGVDGISGPSPAWDSAGKPDSGSAYAPQGSAGPKAPARNLSPAQWPLYGKLLPSPPFFPCAGPAGMAGTSSRNDTGCTQLTQNPD